MSFSPTGNPETPVKMLLMVDVHFYLPRHEVGVADHILMLGTASYGVWHTYRHLRVLAPCIKIFPLGDVWGNQELPLFI